jgi:hypothetical protein
MSCKMDLRDLLGIGTGGLSVSSRGDRKRCEKPRKKVNKVDHILNILPAESDGDGASSSPLCFFVLSFLSFFDFDFFDLSFLLLLSFSPLLFFLP